MGVIEVLDPAVRRRFKRVGQDLMHRGIGIDQ